MLRFCAALFCLVSALPAVAGEGGSRPRLAVGGYDFSMAERRVDLLGSNGLSLGTVSTTPAPGRLAVGGYLAYGLGGTRLSSSLTGDARGNSADLSATYSGTMLGTDGVTALRLGYDWTRPVPFSLNTSQPAYDLLDPPNQGLSLSLSWNHDVTPGLSLGGFAAAGQTQPPALSAPTDDASPNFRVGAGVGVKF